MEWNAINHWISNYFVVSIKGVIIGCFFLYEGGFITREKELAPLVREPFEGKGRRSHAPSWVGWYAEFNEATPTSMTQVPISQLTESMCGIAAPLVSVAISILSDKRVLFLHFSILCNVFNDKCHNRPMT